MSRREIIWRRSRAIARDDGASESTTSGESVLRGEMEMHMRSKLLTTTKPRHGVKPAREAEMAEGTRMPPLHPGEMLREEFMKPLSLSANALAMALRVPVTRITEIVRERRGISADTALRLSRYFNMSAEFWMRLQMDFDLESASDTARHAEIHPRASHLAVSELSGGQRREPGRGQIMA